MYQHIVSSRISRLCRLGNTSMFLKLISSQLTVQSLSTLSPVNLWLPNTRKCLLCPNSSLEFITTNLQTKRWKNSKIDVSKVPVLCESELEETFIKGSGPGGSNVNKRSNCCLLLHKPSGIYVKCHLSRELNQNRKLARQMMIEKLDEHYNGDECVKAQKERLASRKSISKELKAKKVMELKMKYKNLVHSDDSEIEKQCTTNESNPSLSNSKL